MRLLGALALVGLGVGCSTTDGSGSSSMSTSSGGQKSKDDLDISGSGSSPSSGGGNDEDVCAEAEASAQLVPTNLLFVVDTSGSMKCNAPPVDELCELPQKKDDHEPSKWESTQAALVGLDDSNTTDLNEEGVLRSLVDTQGLSAGLITFPVDDRCAILERGEFTTQIAPLSPTQLEAIESDLQLIPDGETPLAGAAIRGLDILRAGLVSGTLPGNSYLVLMTDGVETCQPSALEDLRSYVTQALEDFGISTYVIGAPGSANSRSLLSELAYVGGTPSTPSCQHGSTTVTEGNCHIDLTESSDFSGDLTRVFSGIADETQSACDFDVPNDAFVDPEKVNVMLSKQGASEETIPQDDRDCQGDANGWQYTSSAQEKIVLCGEACQRVRTGTEGQVRVVFGCQETVVR
jgi:hypothetical protein